MKQYQRMVSYLYQYYQGEKGNNVGYVRVERKQQQCHITIRMRPVVLEHMPEIRLFIQEPDGIVYIPLGTLQNNSNSLEAKFVTPADNVFNCGKPINSMEGLLLYVSAKNYFATSWQNDRIFLGDMRTFDTITESNATTENDATIENNTETESDVATDTSDVAAVSVSDIGNDNSSGSTTPDNSDSVTNGSADNVALNNSGSTANNSFGNSSPGNSGPVANNRFGNSSSGNSGPAVNSSLDSSSPDNSNSISNNGFGNGTEARKTNNQRQAAQDALEMQSVCGVCPFKRKNLDYGRKMLCTFPQMHPFPDGKVANCVRIEPQDIGCLPIRLWPLANNSFLLQGYFNYRHLIFVELPDGNYALGVPGICSHREKEAARRYSFPQFMPLSSDGNCNGAFGYWLQSLPSRLD